MVFVRLFTLHDFLTDVGLFLLTLWHVQAMVFVMSSDFSILFYTFTWCFSTFLLASAFAVTFAYLRTVLRTAYELPVYGIVLSPPCKFLLRAFWEPQTAEFLN